jgi:hypothetical protein
MRILKIFSAALLISGATLPVLAHPGSNPICSIYSETPAKTVIIKHPAAHNLNVYFSTTSTLFFEVYKPGSKEDVAELIAVLSKDPRVESCNEGIRTGDYLAMSITLKAQADKEWFVKLCKKAGLNSIKINNDPIKDMDKL